MTEVLVLSPHPDDETIGCGGTLRRHILEGDHVRVVFLTAGEAGGHGTDPEQTGKLRLREAADALAVLGVTAWECWGAPDGRLTAARSLVERLRLALASWNPGVVYVPHGREAHPDHRAAGRIALRALDSQRTFPRVLGFEVWTPVQQMDHIVDVSDVIETKMAALRCYRSQNQFVDFEEAFRGLARYRGALHSWPGGPYAEVFRNLN